MILLIVIYLLACTCLLLFSVRALWLMNRRSCHFRRAAFALIACGSASAFIEAWNFYRHEFSGPMIVVGLAILFALGARETRIEYKRHAHAHHRKWSS